MTEPTEHGGYPSDDAEAEDEGGLSSFLGRAGAAAMRPVHRVARSGREALNDEAERAIDGVMAGPLPETIGRAIVEHRVIERAVTEAMNAKAVEGPALGQEEIGDIARRALESPATTELVDTLVHSPAFKKALKDILSSPEVRAALMTQSTSFAGEIADAVRRRAQRADAALAVRFHGEKAEVGSYGGLATRGVGLVVDLLLAHLVFLIAGAMIGLVSGMIGTLRPAWVVGTIAAFGWLIVLVGYFVIFWSTAGQTPGMRLFRLRVLHGDDPPAVWRSLVRLVGLALAIIPCFAGFVPVLFDSRRRALQDFLAGTVVVYQQREEAV
jgi:uncharacterized RDD family membrane protein YckC